MTRRALLIVPFLCLFALAFPAIAAAHPLGNFTINRYSRLEVQPGLIRIRYVLDEAEIPTYQDMAKLQPGGQPTDQQKQAFLVARVEQLRVNLHLTLAGKALPVELEPGTTTLSFPPGQGGLSLLRVTAWFRAPLSTSAPPAGGGIRFRDDNYSDRLGWKEIVVRATDGAALSQSSVTAVDQSDELRNYPKDMLSSPLDVRSAQFAFTAAPGASAAPAGTPANLLQPRGKSVGLLQVATDAFTALVSRETLSLPFILFALVAAMALGGVHALSPGHGKTIVGAYLVGSRGTARHAAFLGMTVTVTHTAGVFALGLITLFASRYIVPERLYPWLSTISGLLVAIIGAWLLFVRLRTALSRPSTSSTAHDQEATDHLLARPLVAASSFAFAGAPSGGVPVNLGRADRPSVGRGPDASESIPFTATSHAPRPYMDHEHIEHDHYQDHGQTHDHGHTHDHDQAQEHNHIHDHDQTHDHGTAIMAHDHGAGSHTHTVPATNQITWKGLLALGISGGLLPCPSALVVLLAAISLQRVAFGIVLVVAFSLGLAGVLTGIGLLLVYARGFFTHVRLELGLGRLLPAASAAIVMILGILITVQAVGQTGVL